MTAILTIGCSSDNDTNFNESFSIVENAQIIERDTNENPFPFARDNGDNLVFVYQKEDPGEPNIIDDELFETLQFQIDPELDNFSFENEEVEQTLAFYQESGTLIGKQEVINRGVIEGIKIDSLKWEVTIDVEFGDNQTINLKNTFEVIN